MMASIETKTCHRCGNTKPSHAFGVCAKNTDGLNHWCSECTIEYKRENRRVREGATKRMREENEALQQEVRSLRARLDNVRGEYESRLDELTRNNVALIRANTALILDNAIARSTPITTVQPEQVTSPLVTPEQPVPLPSWDELFGNVGFGIENLI